MKECIKCKHTKPLSEYSSDKSRKYGYVNTCKVCRRSYAKDLRIKNGQQPQNRTKKSEAQNKMYHREYRKNKMINDSIFKFKCNTRSLIYNSFKRACKSKFKKSLQSEALLGCTMNEFLIYISNKFHVEMSFDNYGLWHLDHIKPLSQCKTQADIEKYNHFTNFQPLWAKDNILKSNK